MMSTSNNHGNGIRYTKILSTILLTLVVFSKGISCFSSLSRLSCPSCPSCPSLSPKGNSHIQGQSHGHNRSQKLSLLSLTLSERLIIRRDLEIMYFRMTNSNNNNDADADADGGSSYVNASDSNRNRNSNGPRSIGSSSRRRERRSSSINNSDSVASVGPKADSTRRRRSRRSSSLSSGSSNGVVSPNNSAAAAAVVAFDAKKLTSQQNPNEGAMPFDLNSSSSTIRIRPSNSEVNSELNEKKEKDDKENKVSPSNTEATTTTTTITTRGRPILHNHFEHLALDDIFPNLDFSLIFYKNASFREDIRHSMRNDIFYTTPAYSNLSPKVASYMLDDDSSLQGSWNCIPKNRNSQTQGDGDDNDQGRDKINNCDDNDNNNDKSAEAKAKVRARPMRMIRLTAVLKKYLGDEAPTGDEFMMKIGSLCGLNPSNHWIDIIGVKDRVVSHSWHQDTGRSSFFFDDAAPSSTLAHNDEEMIKGVNQKENESDNNDNDDGCNLDKSRYTVMLGFPIEDQYTGTGVFSHALKLTDEHLAPVGHNENEPVLFEGTIDERYIVRPSFSFGREILRYRDVDTLHSAPDVVYRKSVMRFM